MHDIRANITPSCAALCSQSVASLHRVFCSQNCSPEVAVQYKTVAASRSVVRITGPDGLKAVRYNIY